MMKTVLLVAILYSALSAFTQDFGYIQADNSCQELNKKLGVKRMNSLYLKYQDGEEISSYLGYIEFFNQDGFVVRDLDYFSSDTTEYWESTYEYDNQNRVVSCIYYDSDYPNELEGSDITYNLDGNIDSICDYRVEKNITILDSCYRFIYGNKNKLIRVVGSSGEEYELFKYKKDEIHCYDNNKILSKVYKKGKACISYWPEYSYKYEYDEFDRLIKSSKIMNNGDVTRVTKFFYMDNGLLGQSVSFGPNNRMTNASEYSYEFFSK